MTNRFASLGDALHWLTSSTDYERMRRVRYNADTFSLDRMERLAAALRHPQQCFRTVQVAGTKGKGSTAAMIEAILRAHGLRVGLYTSPHLVDLRERVQINRAWADDDLLRQSIERVADAVDEHLASDRPTFFEMMTAVALLCFAEAPVDVAVLEVGLGGRLDATSVVVPEVCVITPVSLDHMAQLGSDLASIAAEKAGIIKPEMPVIVAPQPAEAMAVIRKAAEQRGAPLLEVAPESVAWQAGFDGGRPVSRIDLAEHGQDYGDLILPIPGRVQAVNAACAVAAAEVMLAEQTNPVAVREALASLDWPGRMQAFPLHPTVLLDGAHNAASVSLLMRALADYYPTGRRVVVFASAADKDIAGMMHVLAEQQADVIFTKTDNPRAAEPDELAAALREQGATALGATTDLAAALARARDAAGPEGVVVVCGSLYLVGEVLARQEELGLS